MKMNITIDCTPQEARAFLGLPDLQPLHELYLSRMRDMISDGITAPDMEKVMRQWMPTMASGWEQWQKAIWTAATSQSPEPATGKSDT